MPIPSLKNRAEHLEEIMDSETCDPLMLEQTYRDFTFINAYLTGWKQLFMKQIRPFCTEVKTYTLLDIGFGGGDIPEMISKLAKTYNIDLVITAIETDERALNFVNKTYPNSSVKYINSNTSDLLNSDVSFDFIISNHLLHHLDKNQLNPLANDCVELCTKKIIFSDLTRSYIAYFSHYLLTKFTFKNSFIGHDGLISIRRSYTKNELKEILGQTWNIQSSFPFRLIAAYEVRP